ncbi:uncharacterized protein LOC133178640, partial [Saccostrea echinata]|uniref:uncharacterized protein LOC133178640 n=1 Tax=Saccostrea echinata TaxID=191078 RepID=UPI002A83545E
MPVVFAVILIYDFRTMIDKFSVLLVRDQKSFYTKKCLKIPLDTDEDIKNLLEQGSDGTYFDESQEDVAKEVDEAHNTQKPISLNMLKGKSKINSDSLDSASDPVIPINEEDVNTTKNQENGRCEFKQGVGETVELERDRNPEKKGEGQQRSDLSSSPNGTSDGKHEEFKPPIPVPPEKHDEKAEFSKSEAVLDRSSLGSSPNGTSEGKHEEFKPPFPVPPKKHDEKLEFPKSEAVLNRSSLGSSPNRTLEGKHEEFKPPLPVPPEKYDEKTYIQYLPLASDVNRSTLNKKRSKVDTWRWLFRYILALLFILCFSLGFIFCVYLFVSEVQ